MGRPLAAAAGRWLAASTLAAAVGTGFVAAKAVQARPLDDITDTGYIRIAVYRDFPPFSFVRHGRPAGVDVDLAARIAADLGVRLDLMPITADENVDDDLRNAVWKGHYIGGGVADLMLHVPYDRLFALRNKQAHIFAPYCRIDIVLGTPEETSEDGRDLLAFDSRPIAVEVDSLPDFYLSSAFGGALRDNVVHFLTAEQATEALRDGRAAAVMAPRNRIEAVLGPERSGYRLSPVPMPGFARTSWLIGAAVDEHSRDLAYAVEDRIGRFVEDGTMAGLFQAHGLTYTPPEGD
jgi:ABC-type amino acid transport substrate-binding protein